MTWREMTWREKLMRLGEPSPLEGGAPSVTAGPALSATVLQKLRSDKVVAKQWVATGALGLSSVDGRYAATAYRVFSVGYYLKVPRVDAGGVEAEMVQLKSFRDAATADHFKCELVSPYQNTVDPNASISVSILSAHPFPTSVFAKDVADWSVVSVPTFEIELNKGTDHGCQSIPEVR